MAGRLAGKVALVTGIGSGIGRGCALIFAQEGATVVGTDLDAETAAATAAGAGTPIDQVAPIDLTDRGDVDRCVAHVAAAYGRLDILVNAGAIPPRLGAVERMDYEHDWSATMTGEVDLVFLLCQAAWPLLAKSGAAAIVNFASMNAYRGSINAGLLAHCAAKGAVLAMTRQLAVEGAPLGIRANSISPGLIDTSLTQASGATEGAILQRTLDRVLIKRLGRPEDIAWAAVYLASDEAGWVTGTDLGVNGGTFAW